MRKTPRKKIDAEALRSSFMRVPHMKIEVARSLLNLGFQQLYELNGRAAETLLKDIRKRDPATPQSHLPYLRMLVYAAENDPPEAHRLHPDIWR